MSILVTVAVVCTMSTCNDYVIDTSKTAVTQAAATRAHTTVYNEIWEDEKGLSEWLKKYQIGETIFKIVSIDIESQDIEEADIP